MWVWPLRIRSPPLFNKILSSSYHISFIRPRNCTSPTTSLSITNQQFTKYTPNISNINLSLSPQSSLWMITRRPRVVWIMIISLNKISDFDSLDYDKIHNYLMSLTYINIFIAFTISLLGLLIYRSHIISSLLCLEGIILSLFVIITITILNTHLTLASILPIILLVFAACEAALGLSLLVIVSTTYGIDYVQNLNLLQC